MQSVLVFKIIPSVGLFLLLKQIIFLLLYRDNVVLPNYKDKCSIISFICEIQKAKQNQNRLAFADGRNGEQVKKVKGTPFQL